MCSGDVSMSRGGGILSLSGALEDRWSTFKACDVTAGLTSLTCCAMMARVPEPPLVTGRDMVSLATLCGGISEAILAMVSASIRFSFSLFQWN